jgi:hypothetical protein
MAIAADPTARDTANNRNFVQQRTGTADSFCCQPFFMRDSLQPQEPQLDSAAIARHSFYSSMDCY